MSEENFMELAIAEADLAKQAGDLPFGAIVTQDDEVVGKGHAEDRTTGDVTAHAELQAVRNACKELNRRDLSDCTIYCSNEPCMMCAAAIFQARIPLVVIGASRDDIPQILRPRKLKIDDLAQDSSYKIKIRRGVLKEKVIELFSDLKDI